MKIRIILILLSICFSQQVSAQIRRVEVNLPEVISRVISKSGYGLDGEYLKQICVPKLDKSAVILTEP